MVERENARHALDAKLTNAAVSAVISKKASGNFNKLLKGLTDDG